MEYYTSKEQEEILESKYMEKLMLSQDRIRSMKNLGKKEFILKPDRLFLVENGKVYLERVDPRCECPTKLVQGGKCYEIDYDFINQVQDFVRRHDKYMVVFSISGRYSGEKEYRGGGGIYPARMVADFDELVLEDEEKYVSQVL